MKRALFVCTGNTCRSVLAHYYAAKLAADEKLPLEFSSAGLAADAAIEQPGIVAELLGKEGVRDFSHTPSQLTAEAVRDADLVLGMTAAHKAGVISRFPEAAGKTFTLVDYAGFGRDDIADPFGRDDLFYFEIFKLIKSAVRAALERMKKEVK